MSDPQVTPMMLLADGGGGGSAPSYVWPFFTKDPSQYQRIDQGWDLCDTTITPGNVYAVSAGTVAYSHDPGGFGQNYAVVTLDDTSAPYPAIYYGHCVPVAAEGSHVNQGDVVSTTSKGPQGNADQPGWLEIGWWSGGPAAKGYSGTPTQQGQSMHDTLINAPTVGGQNTPPAATGSSSSGGNSNSASGSGNGNDPTQFGKPDPSQIKQDNIGIADLPDPRDNRPFHAYFSSKAKLVRGGMFELLADMSGNYTSAAQPRARTGGQFACFFMMNPSSIAVECSFDPTVAPPLTVDPASMALLPYFMQNQSISFTIVFNRQYDVWMGGVVNPKTGKPPGPSDMGVRWDIRALERLLGVYDAVNDTSMGKAAGVGEGAMGPGSRPPAAIPIQVVFGGYYSYQFQGTIANFDYTYTLFDANMIPVEASVDITIMRQYLPNLSSADVVTNWTGVTGQYKGVGSFWGPAIYTPPGTTSFNSQLGNARVFGGQGGPTTPIYPSS